ncbi:MAG: CHAT domain-containing tetratricopeptide repeat protein, partial [Bacteroidota bacterium]
TREEKADIYNNLATLSNLSKNYNTAKYYLSQAKQVIPKDDLFLSSNNLLIYSATLAANKDYLLAKENFLEALKLRKKLFPEKHPFVALAYHYTAEKLYANRHQHHTALAYYQQALEQLVIDFEYCGNKYENPPIKDVQINDRLVLLEVLALKAKSLQAIENQSLAQSTLQLAIDLIDDIRLNYLAEGSKYILLEKAMPIYEQAIALGLEMQELAWAFEVAERSKATLLLESIQNNEAQIYAGIDSTLLQKEQAQKVEIAFYERLLNEANSEEDKQQYQQVLFDLRQDYHQFLAQLEADHPDYYQLKYNLQFPSAADIQQQILEDESALLEYFVSNEFIYLFTLTKEDVAIQKIPKSEDFEQNLQAFRALISSPESTPNSFAQYTNQAFSVYDAYLKDALEKLPNNIQKLLFIPDGALNYIPFQALIEHPIATPKIEQARFDTLSYLTKKYAISYAYSSNLLLSMNQQKPKKTLKFGGFAPIFSGEKVVALRNTMLNELPYSRTEVQQINKLMQGEPFFKQNASLENFKQQAGEFNILHLSTHAALDDQNPDQSRIHLYDDYITVNEIYNLPIRADLTVLSACETGVGKFKRGEGLLSLARAFMYAGCPSLVTSLWQVNDQKTASLMINFYGELANGRTKAKALQIAQINYLNNISTAQAAHPFYWAAFVQTGNSAALIQERLQMNWVWFLMFPLLLVLAWWTSSKIT